MMEKEKEDRPAKVITVDRETINEEWYCGYCKRPVKQKWERCPKCGKLLLWKGR